MPTKQSIQRQKLRINRFDPELISTMLLNYYKEEKKLDDNG